MFLKVVFSVIKINIFEQIKLYMNNKIKKLALFDLGYNFSTIKLFSEPKKLTINPRAARLAKESIFSYHLLLNIITEFPKFNDDEIYEVVIGCNMGIPLIFFQNIYKAKIKENHEEK